MTQVLRSRKHDESKRKTVQNFDTKSKRGEQAERFERVQSKKPYYSKTERKKSLEKRIKNCRLYINHGKK